MLTLAAQPLMVQKHSGADTVLQRDGMVRFELVNGVWKYGAVTLPLQSGRVHRKTAGCVCTVAVQFTDKSDYIVIAPFTMMNGYWVVVMNESMKAHLEPNRHINCTMHQLSSSPDAWCS
jgi:hypothetical protein